MFHGNTALEVLRTLPSMVSGNSHSKREAWPFSLLKEGLPKGAITEISGEVGSGKTEVVLRFLAENTKVRVAWIEEDLTVYPCSFPQNQVGLERVLFVDSAESKKDAIWSAHQVLRSQLFAVIVLVTHQNYDETTLRRLQLAAEKSQACVILLSEKPTQEGSWPLSVQLAAQRQPSFFFDETQAQPVMLAVLKYRGQVACV